MGTDPARSLPRQSEMADLHADIDATGEIEDAMVAAARELVESHGYTLSDLLSLLEATLDLEEEGPDAS